MTDTPASPLVEILEYEPLSDITDDENDLSDDEENGGLSTLMHTSIKNGPCVIESSLCLSVPVFDPPSFCVALVRVVFFYLSSVPPLSLSLSLSLSLFSFSLSLPSRHMPWIILQQFITTFLCTDMIDIPVIEHLIVINI